MLQQTPEVWWVLGIGGQNRDSQRKLPGTLPARGNNRSRLSAAPVWVSSPHTAAPDQVFVNSTTGNLVIQGTDEILTATGADIAVARTYNSVGITEGDNNDGWRVGVLGSLVINADVSIIKTYN